MIFTYEFTLEPFRSFGEGKGLEADMTQRGKLMGSNRITSSR